MPAEVENGPPFTKATLSAALARLEDVPLRDIEREILAGLRVRPLDKWCRACHRWLRYLLWRANAPTE